VIVTDSGKIWKDLHGNHRTFFTCIVFIAEKPTGIGMPKLQACILDLFEEIFDVLRLQHEKWWVAH
jgi:hypothetical protein